MIAKVRRKKRLTGPSGDAGCRSGSIGMAPELQLKDLAPYGMEYCRVSDLATCGDRGGDHWNAPHEIRDSIR